MIHAFWFTIYTCIRTDDLHEKKKEKKEEKTEKKKKYIYKKKYIVMVARCYNCVYLYIVWECAS